MSPRITATAIALTLALLAAVLVSPPLAAAGSPRLAGCPILPSDNVWNRPVDDLPIHPDSDAYVRSIGLGSHLHPDFGSYAGYGIPWNVVRRDTKRRAVTFRWPGESDKGPYPIPRRPRIEGGSDRHILMIDRDRCTLYELFAARRRGGRWHAGSGAIWDLRSNRLRPAGWTSADAAGLPILPGLVRPDEVKRGRIDHAIRITFDETRRAYLSPATHYASDICATNVPPMGMRFRLRPGYSLAGFTGQAKVVATALKEYGAIVADNGTDWYITGAKSRKWNDENLNQLKEIPGDDFQVVDTGEELTSGCGPG